MTSKIVVTRTRVNQSEEIWSASRAAARISPGETTSLHDFLLPSTVCVNVCKGGGGGGGGSSG